MIRLRIALLILASATLFAQPPAQNFPSPPYIPSLANATCIGADPLGKLSAGLCTSISGTLTTNGLVPFITAAQTVSQDSGFYWDSTNHRLSIATGGAVASTFSDNVFNAHAGTNQNMQIGPGFSYATGVALEAVNDANTANVDMDIRAGNIFLRPGISINSGTGHIQAGTLYSEMNAFAQGQFPPGNPGSLLTVGFVANGPGEPAIMGVGYDTHSGRYTTVGGGGIECCGFTGGAGVGVNGTAGTAAYNDSNGSGNADYGLSGFGVAAGTNVAGDFPVGVFAQTGIGGGGISTSGNLAGMAGFYVTIPYAYINGGNGTATFNCGLCIADQSVMLNSTGTKITSVASTTYGFKIDDQSAGGTNNFSLYTGTGPVRLGGALNVVGGYSANGTAGVSSTTCTQWTQGLCTHS